MPQMLYGPSFSDYKPINSPLNMEMIFKIAQMGQEKIGNQLALLQKVSDKAGATDAYLQQDIDKVSGTTKEIDAEIERLVSDNVNLLDPKNTAGVMKIAKKYMNDPELVKIAGRTARIRNSFKLADAMTASGKTTAANYWEFKNSLAKADEEYGKSGKYDPNIKLHYDIVPYTDVTNESSEAIKNTKFYSQSQRVTTRDHMGYTQTIQAVNPVMAKRMADAERIGNFEEVERLKQENEIAIAADFSSRLSPGALAQLEAEAKAQGVSKESYIANYAMGMASQVSGYNSVMSDYGMDEAYKMQLQFNHQKALKQMEIDAQKEAAKLARAQKKADEAGKEEGATLRGTPLPDRTGPMEHSDPLGLGANPTMGRILEKEYELTSKLPAYGEVAKNKANAAMSAEMKSAGIVYTFNSTTGKYGVNTPTTLSSTNQRLADEAKIKADELTRELVDLKQNISTIKGYKRSIMKASGLTEAQIDDAARQGRSARANSPGMAVARALWSDADYIDAELLKLKGGDKAIEAAKGINKPGEQTMKSFAINGITASTGLNDTQIRKAEIAGIRNTIGQGFSENTATTISAAEKTAILDALNEKPTKDEEGNLLATQGISTAQYVYNPKKGSWEIVVTFASNNPEIQNKTYRFPANNALVQKSNLDSYANSTTSAYIMAELQKASYVAIPSTSASITQEYDPGNGEQMVNILTYHDYTSDLTANNINPAMAATKMQQFENALLPSILAANTPQATKQKEIAGVLMSDFGYTTNSANGIATIILNNK